MRGCATIRFASAVNPAASCAAVKIVTNGSAARMLARPEAGLARIVLAAVNSAYELVAIRTALQMLEGGRRR